MQKGWVILDSIGQRIRKARLNLNLNQREFAKKANIYEANLSRYENEIREPKSAVISRLAEALEVSADYLLGISDDMNYDKYDLSKKSTMDMENLLKDIESKLSTDGLMFCGKPASKESVDTVIKAIKIGINMAIEDEKLRKDL